LYQNLGLTGSIRVRAMFVYEDSMLIFLSLMLFSLCLKDPNILVPLPGDELVTSDGRCAGKGGPMNSQGWKGHNF
jgi:hypothetical protein